MINGGIQLRPVAQFLCLALIAAAGCATKSKAQADARAAFMAGQQQGMMQAQDLQRTSVRFIGDVKSPLIEWTQDLTLAEAVIAAEYQGRKTPREIIIFRRGQAIHFEPHRLLRGEDMLLMPGDIVEIRP
jgi:hypothetical protein